MCLCFMPEIFFGTTLEKAQHSGGTIYYPDTLPSVRPSWITPNQNYVVWRVSLVTTCSNMLYPLSQGPNDITQSHKYIHHINISRACYTPKLRPKLYNPIFLTNINHDYTIVLLNMEPSNATINTLVLQPNFIGDSCNLWRSDTFVLLKIHGTPIVFIY